ncbi:MAG: sensor histidine kinase [Leptolyngbya sp. DLM2.Bin15]|nr:MAG: sensor histidine kinase [Leptolyngbya sp. DLM2.Bin15]
MPSSPSLDYPKWQHRFMLERLRLIGILAIVLLGCLTVLNLLVVIPAVEMGQQVSLTPGLSYRCIMSTLAQGLGLVLGLVLLKDARTRNYPGWLFLWLSWSISLLPQLQVFLKGEVIFNPISWMIVFTAQAILLPVRWRLHLLSQVVLLGSVGGAVLLGFENVHFATPPNLSPAMASAMYSLVGFQLFSVCFISNLGVYLYERMMRQEFELRRQIRLFLHAVSHDLRNPVLGTLMVLRNLRNPSGETVLSQGILDRMIESGDRQVELIDSLLEAYTIETQGIQLHCQPLSLGNTVQQVLNNLYPSIQDAGAIVSVKLPDTLPLVEADPTQLHRVYQNLILNALRYNAHGLHLSLSAQVMGEYLRCTIHDNGPGLSAEQCDQLFNLCTRGPNARQTLGLGLGLYICQQIIEAHHGTIGVSSTCGQGTTLWFDLPIAFPA